MLKIIMAGVLSVAFFALSACASTPQAELLSTQVTGAVVQVGKPTLPNQAYPNTMVKSRCVYVESAKWFTCPHGKDPACFYRVVYPSGNTYKVCAAKRPRPRTH